MGDKIEEYPKVSIITVVYNGVKTIEQTILSVINQTYNNIEYIIIDGGSVDGTVDIIKKYEARLAYWVSEPDNGIYDAMNKGIMKSSGLIIGIINSDDYYHLYAVQNAVFYFKHEENYEIIHGDLIMLNGRKNDLEHWKPNLKSKDYMKGMLYFHPTFFVKKSTYAKIGVFSAKYKISSDFDFFVRAKKSKLKFKYSSNIVVFMRLGGISSINQRLAFKENRNISINHGQCYLRSYMVYFYRILRFYFDSVFKNYNCKNDFVVPKIKRL